MESRQSADGLTVPALDASQPPGWKLWAERVLRWGLAIYFIVAAVPKIVHPDLFAEAVNNYQMLPMFLVNWMVIFLPWLEIVCGLALLAGIGVRGASSLIAVLLVVFLYAMASAIYRGLDISCGCTGVGGNGERIGYEEIARDAVMLAVAGMVMAWHRPGKGRR